MLYATVLLMVLCKSDFQKPQ